MVLGCIILGCASGGNKESPKIANEIKYSDYDARISNVFRYMEESDFSISMDQCFKLVILQTNLCNSCDKEKLEVILDSLSSTREKVYFILADESEDIRKQIEVDRPDSDIFIDRNHLLQDHNLNFLRNLQIDICDNKISKWKFL